jgi:hypothetical protein
LRKCSCNAQAAYMIEALYTYNDPEAPIVDAVV